MDFRADGLHGVLGPPGAGKSSVFAGLLFSLYGNPGPDQDLLDLRYDKSEPGAVVSADYAWVHDGCVYRTLRELRRGTRKGQPVEKSAARMWCDGVEIEQITPTEMTKKVTEVLAMTDRSFAGSVLIRQGEVDILTTAPPSTVQQMVENHTGIGDIAKLRDTARKNASEARAVADAMPGTLDAVHMTADALAAAEANTAQLVALADAASVKASRARSNWQTANDDAEDLRRRDRDAQRSREAIVSAEGAARAAQDAAESAGARVEELGVPADLTVADLDARHQQVSEERVAAGELGNAVHYARREVAAASRDSHAAHAEMESTAHERERLASEVARGQDELTTLGEQTNAAAVEVGTADAAAAQLGESLQALRDAHAQCPTCGQNIDDARALVSALTAQHEASTQAAAAARRRGSHLRNRCDALSEELASLRGRIDQIDKVVAAADQCSGRLRRAEQVLVEAVTAFSALVDVDDTDPEVVMAAARTHIAALDAKLGTIDEQRSAVRAAEVARQQVQRASDRLHAARAAAQDAPDPRAVDDAITCAAQLRVAMDVLAQESAEACRIADAANAECAPLRSNATQAARHWEQKQDAVRDAEVADTVAAALAAYRQDLIADFCNGISVAATELLERFGGEHVAFHLDSDFVPRVELGDGRLRKTSALSGGEKARVGLAFRLGISMQISDSQLPDQILGDEITQYLDEDGRRQVVATIAQLFTSPIIVSHTSEILDHAAEIHELVRSPLGATRVACAA